MHSLSCDIQELLYKKELFIKPHNEEHPAISAPPQFHDKAMATFLDKFSLRYMLIRKVIRRYGLRYPFFNIANKVSNHFS